MTLASVGYPGPPPGPSQLILASTVSNLFHDPFDSWGLPKNYILHGFTVAFDHCARFRLWDEFERTGNGFFEPLPGLPEGDEIVLPDRIL